MDRARLPAGGRPRVSSRQTRFLQLGGSLGRRAIAQMGKGCNALMYVGSSAASVDLVPQSLQNAAPNIWATS